MTNQQHGRDAQRVVSDQLLEIHVPGTPQACTGQVRDLSRTGVQFITYMDLEPGMHIQLRLSVPSAQLPSLETPAEVVRRRVVSGGQGFVVACTFEFAQGVN